MSFQIGVVRGIPIRLHASLLLTALLMLLQLGAFGIPATVLLLGSIVAHELGHAVVAQKRGVGVAGIHLHLLGGTALMTSSPRTPRHEIEVAAAGPLVSIGLAVSFWLFAGLLPGGLGVLAGYGAVMNGVLAAFNLLPALPMDGGRIFRAALTAKLGPLKATEVAAKVSRGFGVLFIVGALAWGSLSLGLIGLFLFFLVGQEEQMARARASSPWSTGPDMSGPARFHVPLRQWAQQRQWGQRPRQTVVIDVGEGQGEEVYVDRFGRRWVRDRRR